MDYNITTPVQLIIMLARVTFTYLGSGSGYIKHLYVHARNITKPQYYTYIIVHVHTQLYVDNNVIIVFFRVLYTNCSITDHEIT